MDAIISASISAIGAVLICLVTNYATQKKTEALLLYRIGLLEEKMDKHNNLVERLTRAEVQIADLESRVDDLK